MRSNDPIRKFTVCFPNVNESLSCSQIGVNPYLGSSLDSKAFKHSLEAAQGMGVEERAATAFTRWLALALPARGAN